MVRVGVDVGGTNTDLVLEADRGIYVHKVPSTPHDQSEGVLIGLRELCDIVGLRPQDISLIVHGTTIATNITIEHNGAEVGMLTSHNFRDILHIGPRPLTKIGNLVDEGDFGGEERVGRVFYQFRIASTSVED